MKDNKDNIKKAFGSLHDFEADPPVDLWDRIETKMRRQKRLTILRYTSLAATILILLGIGVSILVLSDSRNSNIQNFEVASKQGKDNVSESDKNTSKNDASDEGTPLNDLKNNVHSDKSVKLQVESTLADNTPNKNKSNLINKDVSTKILDIYESDSSIIVSVLTENLNTSINGKLDSMALASRLDRLQDSMMQVRAAGLIIDSVALAEILKELNGDPEIQVQEKRGLAFALGYGSGGSIDLSSSKDYLDATSNNFSPEKLTSSIADQTSYYREISNVEHKPPLSIGATISYPFARKWSLETGIVYTRLGYSLETYIQNSSNMKYNIELHYLGIPMGIRFQLFEKKRFGMYIFESLILEKGITSRALSNQYTNYSLITSDSESVPIRGVQLSSFTGIGMEARTFNRLYLYGQGGVQAFFLNKTQPFNIRSEHVAWPSFQLGLRFRLK